MVGGWGVGGATESDGETSEPESEEPGQDKFFFWGGGSGPGGVFFSSSLSLAREGKGGGRGGWDRPRSAAECVSMCRLDV